MKIIKTEYGKLSGVETPQPGVLLYKGVPIGKTTGGENRFRPPVKAEPWEGVRKCDKYPERFVQDINGNPAGSFYHTEFYTWQEHEPPVGENGLAVNVYVPENAAGLPVYVYFHGGGGVGGNASEREFCAERLSALGIIVVLAQYRLGFFGAYVSDDGSNLAVRDAVLCLEWVRDNIASFGGDRERVTVGGQSAGAFMVKRLLCCKKAKGLFCGAVLQSGFTGLAPYKIGADCLTVDGLKKCWAETVKNVFGREEMSMAELRSLDWRDLMVDGAEKWYSLMPRLPEIAIDGEYFTEESVDLTREGALYGINILIGGTSDEFPPLTDKPAEDVREQSDECMRGYLSSVRAVDGRNRNSEIYMYYFTQVPPGRDAAYYGAFHSAELWYIFGSMKDEPKQREWRESDRETAKLFSQCLADFVKTGRPHIEWKSCSRENGCPVYEINGGRLFMTDKFE